MAVNKKDDKRFQNLTVDYRSLMRLNVSERMNMINSVEGRSLIANIEPEQVAAAFPNYYRKDTNVFGKKLQGLMSSPDSFTKPRSGDRSGLSESNRSALGVGRRRSDVGAQAQLSKEQKETFDLLQKGKIDADDPRVAFLKSISEADLKKFGINASTGEDGKKSFAMEPTKASQMPDEELAASLKAKSSVSGSPYLAEQRQRYIEELKSNPELTDKFMRAMRAEAAGAGTKPEKLADVMEATFNRAQMRGHSIDAELRSAFFGPINRNHPNFTKPLSDSERKANESALGDVAQGRNRIQLRTDQGMSTDPTAKRLYEKDPEKWGKLNFGDGNNYYFMDEKGKKFYQQQEQARQEYDAAHSKTDGPATAEQLAAERTRLSTEEITRRQAGLAGALGAQRQTVSSRVVGGQQIGNLQLSGGALARGHDESLGKMNPELKARIAAAIADLPENMRNGVTIGSGYRDPNDPRIQQLYKAHKASGSTRPMADPHSSHHGRNEGEGGAADLEGLPKDRESVKLIEEAFRKHGLHAPVGGEGFSDNGMPHIQMMKGVTKTSRYYQPETEQQAEAPVEPRQEQQAVAPVEPEPVSSMPDGGDLQTDTESLSVYQMDKNKLQRDDSIALDDGGKPVFTMNSKESMKFDPNTGKVEVDNGSKGLRNDPNKLGPAPEPTARDRHEEKVVQTTGPAAAAARAEGPPPQSSTQSSYDLSSATMSMTDNMFKSPSFERAIARTRFHNSGDAALGGHFDGKAANMV